MTKIKQRIIVFGGTGYYGSKVVKQLLLRGVEVKVITRNLKKARKLFKDWVEIYEGDVTNRNTIINSLDGITGVVICLSTLNKKFFDRMEEIEHDAVLNIIEEAEKKGVNRLVYLSGYELREEFLHDVKSKEFGENKIEIEDRIRKSNLNWTILGCAPSFDLFFSFIRKRKMMVPGGVKKPIPSVSVQDVGEIAAQSVLRYDLNGKRLRLTCPKAYSFPEAAEKMTDATGYQIKHITIPLLGMCFFTWVLQPFNRFPRFLYKNLVLLNNFPVDLVERVPKDHKALRELFDYHPVSLDKAIRDKIKRDKL
ncbi:MAG: NAD(P)H-binding protein [Bacteroidales bacterium]|nr:NAD(P)H-binding protein [Bacteroidales bacterium]